MFSYENGDAFFRLDFARSKTRSFRSDRKGVQLVTRIRFFTGPPRIGLGLLTVPELLLRLHLTAAADRIPTRIQIIWSRPAILADINFRVSAGEFVFVSGPSGAGKSTLLKLIGGLEPASRGSIQVNGQRLDKLPARARPYLRRAVGVILQDTHLLFDRSAFENVMLPLAVQGHPWDSAASRARAALDKVGLLGQRRPESHRTIRRRAAAPGDRARHREPARHPDCRRAHRQP